MTIAFSPAEDAAIQKLTGRLVVASDTASVNVGVTLTVVSQLVGTLVIRVEDGRRLLHVRIDDGSVCWAQSTPSGRKEIHEYLARVCQFWTRLTTVGACAQNRRFPHL